MTAQTKVIVHVENLGILQLRDMTGVTNENIGSVVGKDDPDAMASVCVDFMVVTYGDNVMRMSKALCLDIGVDELWKVLDDSAVKMTHREREIVDQGWRLLRAREAITSTEWAQKCEQEKMVWTLSESAHVPLTFLSVFLSPAHTGSVVVSALGNAPVAAAVISDGQSQHPQLISFVKFWDFCGNEVDSRGLCLSQ